MVSETKGPWFNLPSFRRLRIGFSASLAEVTPLSTCIHFSEHFPEDVSLCPNGALPRNYNQWVLTVSTSFSLLLVGVKPFGRRLLRKPCPARRWDIPVLLLTVPVPCRDGETLHVPPWELFILLLMLQRKLLNISRKKYISTKIGFSRFHKKCFDQLFLDTLARHRLLHSWPQLPKCLSSHLETTALRALLFFLCVSVHG